MDVPKYRILGMHLMTGKFDWVLLRNMKVGSGRGGGGGRRPHAPGVAAQHEGGGQGGREGGGRSPLGALSFPRSPIWATVFSSKGGVLPAIHSDLYHRRALCIDLRCMLSAWAMTTTARVITSGWWLRWSSPTDSRLIRGAQGNRGMELRLVAEVELTTH